LPREQPARARAFGGQPIVAVEELALVERQAAAADAPGYAVAQALQLPDPMVEIGCPQPRDFHPVLPVGNVVGRQPRQHLADLGEWNADLLGDLDNRDAPQHVLAIAPLVAAGAVARDQPLGFIEMQGRDGHAGAARDLADREFLRHKQNSA